MSYDSQHPLALGRAGRRESLGEVTYHTSRDIIFFGSEEHHDVQKIREAEAQGYEFWGWCDTWLKKSQGGYTMHFVCRTKEDVASLGVNLFVFPVDEAIKEFCS